MFFCPNCNNTFDITKDITSVKQTGGKEELVSDSFSTTTTTTTTVDNKNEVDVIINKILKKEELENDLIESLDINNIVKNIAYKKLNIKDKELVFNTIQDLLPKEKKKLNELKFDTTLTDNKAYFMCNNCGFIKNIEPKTLIFSRRSDSMTQNFGTKGYKHLLNSNIVPRTKKYICPKQDCISHKDLDKKEAIFFRTNNTYNVKYICRACETIF